MTFTDWWNADRLTQTNPYREDSPMYWAWEGWVAGSIELDRIASELQDTCHKQAKRIKFLEQVVGDRECRIEELESTIRSHGIPVKSFSGGEAHYCTPAEEPACNPHPDAPHGFVRDASHSAGRYVCECHGWEPSEYDDLNKEITRLSRIEDVALEVVDSETWSGDAFYDKLCKLKDVLGEAA